MIGTMKIKIIFALTGLMFLICGASGFAAETNSAATDLKDLVGRINTKLQANQNTETALASELKEFDALLAKHKGEAADDLAQILSMKGGLYLQVLDQPEKAAETFKQLKHDFPETKAGQRTDEVLAMIAQQVEVKKIQDTLDRKSVV